VSGQLLALAALPLRERDLDTHCKKGWMGPRASLNMKAKRKSPAPVKN